MPSLPPNSEPPQSLECERAVSGPLDAIRLARCGELAKRRYVRKELPLLGAFVAALDTMFSTNVDKTKRERLTYQRMFEKLRLAGCRARSHQTGSKAG